jgi:hypothetical protein
MRCKLLLESEDHGPNGPGVEPDNDGWDSARFAGENVGCFQQLVDGWDVLDELFLQGSFKDGENEFFYTCAASP